MLETKEQVRALVHDLTGATWTLGAIATLFESGLVDLLKEPRSLDDLAAGCPALGQSRIERIVGVLATAGVLVSEGGRHRVAEGVLPLLQHPARAALEGEMRGTLMQPLALLDGARRGEAAGGWRHTDPLLLQAQGAASGGFPPMFKMAILPALDDLAQRLERPGARFLDVGVGVAALSIGMCALWPELRVVGLDCFEVPLALARANVAAADFDERIELRQLAVEELRDEEPFDLAWLPAPFIPPPKLAAAIERVRASLRPGGWLLFPIMGAAGDERQRAVWHLINELWGGAVLSLAEGEARLRDAGFTTVRDIPGPPWAPGMLVAKR